MFPFTMVDGAAVNDGWVRDEAAVQMTIQEHEEEITSDVMVDWASYYVNLVIPWLTKHHPQIGWRKRALISRNQITIERTLDLMKRDQDETTHKDVWETTSRQVRRNE